MRLRAVVGSRGFWISIFVLLLAGMALSAWLERRAERDSPRARAEAVQNQVRLAQAEAERCLDDLETSSLRFDAQQRETRALEERIEVLQSLDDRGVPADSYEVYLEAVDRFNASIERWEMRGEVLESTQSECRSLVEERNLLADSLREILVEMGYLPDPDASPLGLPGDPANPGDSVLPGDTLLPDTLSPLPPPGGSF